MKKALSIIGVLVLLPVIYFYGYATRRMVFADAPLEVLDKKNEITEFKALIPTRIPSRNYTLQNVVSYGPTHLRFDYCFQALTDCVEVVENKLPDTTAESFCMYNVTPAGPARSLYKEIKDVNENGRQIRLIKPSAQLSPRSVCYKNEQVIVQMSVQGGFGILPGISDAQLIKMAASLE